MSVGKVLKKADTSVFIHEFLGDHFKSKPPDCNLYSGDGYQFTIHKDIFCQTPFMREILKSAKEECCGTLDILVPSMNKEELRLFVEFFYTGQISANEELLKTHLNLFGYDNIFLECPMYHCKFCKKKVPLPESPGHFFEEVEELVRRCQPDMEVNRHIKCKICGSHINYIGQKDKAKYIRDHYENDHYDIIYDPPPPNLEMNVTESNTSPPTEATQSQVDHTDDPPHEEDLTNLGQITNVQTLDVNDWNDENTLVKSEGAKSRHKEIRDCELFSSDDDLYVVPNSPVNQPPEPLGEIGNNEEIPDFMESEPGPSGLQRQISPLKIPKEKLKEATKKKKKRKKPASVDSVTQTKRSRTNEKIRYQCKRCDQAIAKSKFIAHFSGHVNLSPKNSPAKIVTDKIVLYSCSNPGCALTGTCSSKIKEHTIKEHPDAMKEALAIYAELGIGDLKMPSDLFYVSKENSN